MIRLFIRLRGNLNFPIETYILHRNLSSIETYLEYEPWRLMQFTPRLKPTLPFYVCNFWVCVRYVFKIPKFEHSNKSYGALPSSGTARFSIFWTKKCVISCFFWFKPPFTGSDSKLFCFLNVLKPFKNHFKTTSELKLTTCWWQRHCYVLVRGTRSSYHLQVSQQRQDLLLQLFLFIIFCTLLLFMLF